MVSLGVPMTRRWMLALLIFSGFAGLSYELLWVRLLTFSLGSTTASFSVVLAVFFGGLAAGSRWAGKRSLVVKAPLRAYALLELATGGLGLLLYPVLVSLGPLIARVDPGVGAPALLFRLVVAAVVLLPPTFLMGATLPFVTVATVKSDAQAGSGVSLIYGVNTLGACLGAYTITFQLLPHLGIFGSTLVVVLVNVTVGVVALVMGRRDDGRVAQAPDQQQSVMTAVAPTDPKVSTAVILATLVGGFAATGSQIIWARAFAILLGGTSYGIGSVLVSVLVGIALGSLLAARLMSRSTHRPFTAAIIQAAGLAGVVTFIVGLPLAGYLVGLLPTAGLTGDPLHHGDLLLVFLLLAVPTIASGASMPALISVLGRNAAEAGETLSRVYTANTVGCIAGSLTVGLVLLPMIGSAAILYLLFLLLTLALVVFLVATCGDRRVMALGLGGCALAGAAAFPSLDTDVLSPRTPLSVDYFTYLRSLKAARGATISKHEGDVATVEVTTIGRGTGLLLNGLGQGSRNQVPPDIAFESTLVATIPWQHAPRHERALVVGLGAGGTVKELLQLGVGSLEVAELEKGVVAAVEEIWKDQNPLSDPRVKVIDNDARSYLLSASSRSPHSYDFITSMPAHPWVASALFTTEFFELVKANLAEEGVFSTWFGPSNMPDRSIEALFGAFTSVFPSWFVYWVPEAGAFYLVGSTSPLVFDVAAIDQLSRHAVYSGLDSASVAPAYFASHLVAQSSTTPTAFAVKNTDDNGLIEFGVQRPRKTNPLEVAKKGFSVQGLTPETIRGADPRAFLLEALEMALGSRAGRLPLTGKGTGAAPGMASALAGTNLGELSRYAQARQLLADGKLAEAAKLAASLTDPELQLRFGRFAAWSQNDVATRLAALGALPSRPDVRAAIVASGGFDSGELVVAPGRDDDPLGWLFVEPAAWNALGVDERAKTMAKLQGRLEEFRSPALFRLAGEKARAAGLPQLELLARERLLATQKAEARRALGEAYEAGSKGDFARALAQFRLAMTTQPIDLDAARLFLRTAVRQNSAEAIAEARALLIYRQLEPETVDALIVQYRADDVKEAQESSARRDAGTPTP